MVLTSILKMLSSLMDLRKVVTLDTLWLFIHGKVNIGKILYCLTSVEHVCVLSEISWSSWSSFCFEAREISKFTERLDLFS